MENSFKNEEEEFSLESYLDSQSPTENIIIHIHNQAINPEPVSYTFQELTNISNPILENDEQLNNYDNQIIDSDQSSENNNNGNISTILVDGRSRRTNLGFNTEDFVNFNEVEEDYIEYYENLIDPQIFFNDSESNEEVNLREDVIDTEKKDVIMKKCKGFLIDNKSTFKFIRNIFSLFNRGVKENNEIIPLKKESIRGILIRGHNRLVKKALKSHKPLVKNVFQGRNKLKNLLNMKFAFLEEEEEEENEYYRKSSDYINHPKIKNIFKSICSPFNNPTNERQKVGDAKAKKYFTDNYCKEYFGTVETSNSFSHYIDFLLRGDDLNEYCRRLGIKCCLPKPNNTHEDDCQKKWKILKEFLMLGLLGLSICEFKKVKKDIELAESTR